MLVGPTDWIGRAAFGLLSLIIGVCGRTPLPG
jgi:hypothetical protein